MGSVQSLHGVAAPGAPDAQLVKLLEGLLEEAKGGRLRAFTFVGLSGSGDSQRPILPGDGEGVMRTVGDARSILAQLCILKANIVDAIRKEQG